VLHVVEVGLSGASDRRVLAAACRDRRAVLTHNVGDFVRLADEHMREAKDHHGVVLSPQIPLRLLLARTLSLLSRTDAEDLRNVVRWLPR
jgi:hypothetical protein